MFVFVFFMLLKEKQQRDKKWKRSQNPIIIVLFKGGHPKMRRMKKWIFSKNCLTLLCQEGRKRIFVHTICFGQNLFGPKQSKPGKTIKMVVSAEAA